MEGNKCVVGESAATVSTPEKLLKNSYLYHTHFRRYLANFCYWPLNFSESFPEYYRGGGFAFIASNSLSNRHNLPDEAGDLRHG